MPETSLHQLARTGQSAWLDYISRSLMDSGRLKELIDQGLLGMTSNPSIFHQAISKGTEYDSEILQLKRQGKSTFEIYDMLTIKDIQQACDAFKLVYDQTSQLDGYVSLEINPQLAQKTQESIDEGKRLFETVDRANLMIKVPSTPEGFPVFEELIAAGINVNVTLIFSLDQYIKTVEAYCKGLTRLADSGGDLRKVRSVASVFVSRVDTLMDKELGEGSELAGKAAVANCRIIFEKFKELFDSSEWKDLEGKGANVQRVLWGSTSTKNPAYSDIKYVEELIADPTVNTIPEKTLAAFIDHGKAETAFQEPVSESTGIIDALREKGINIDDVCAQLLDAGVAAFVKSFEELLESIEKKAEALVT